MNKREFLRDIERRLSILDEQEIKDIINEYEGIINEKVKDGKSETDAVSEFGNIEELSSEILKAYKINPKYCNRDSIGRDKTKEFARSFEEWIKYVSGEMAKFLKTAGDNLGKSGRTPSVELVLEIVVKIVILLIILAILKIPFNIIGGMWVGIFNFSFTPVDWMFTILWKIISLVVYLAAAVCIFWAMFRDYFTGFNSPEKSADSNIGVESKSKTEREEKVSDNKTLPQKEPQKPGPSRGIACVLLTIFRVFVTITVLLPLWLTQAGLLIAIFITIYFFVEGINIQGLIIILAGAMTAAAGLSDLIYKLAFKIRKVSLLCIVPFIISIVLVTAGSLIFAHNVLNFEYTDGLPENIKYSTIEKTFNMKEEKRIITNNLPAAEYEINEELNNGEVVVIMSYIDEIGKINNIEILDFKTGYYLVYTYKYFARIYDLRELFDLLMNDLKNNKVYNYSKLNKPDVVLKANTITMKTIRGENY